jgi:hypothetical protein
VTLHPPINVRPIALGDQLYVPLGTTEHGWECGIVQTPSEIYAVVFDGLSRHEGLRVSSPEAAADDLSTLLHMLEATIHIARNRTGTAGSN